MEDGLQQGLLTVPSSREALIDEMSGFLGGYGRRFYKAELPTGKRVVFQRKGEKIKDYIRSKDSDLGIACFGAGQEILSASWTES